jgi:hypothetical protein
MLSEMNPILLALHSYWRWAVLLAAGVALIVAVAGLTGRRPFAPWGRKAGVLYVTALDMQFVLGLLLYAASPLTRIALSDMASAMRIKELRFFAVEHLILMLLAVAVAHIGSVRAKHAPDDKTKYRRTFVWYAASLVLLVVGIPWWRPLLRNMTGG